MIWEKKGRIFEPDGSLWWAKRYAAIPTPVLLDDNTIRIIISSRDDEGVSRIGYLDVDAGDPAEIKAVSQEPILDIGTAGNFDDNGVLPSCYIDLGEKKLLFYMGFLLGVKVRYYIFSGLAVSEDNGKTFARASRVPILDRNEQDLFFRTAPFVVNEDNKWRMWYIGGGEWTDVGGKAVPVYRMKYLESKDYGYWKDAGKTCLDFVNEDEHGFGRPYVFKENGAYKMFYSIRLRSRGYRTGYAESADGLTWERRDEEAGIDVSGDGWDSEMICFASIIKVRNNTVMFYNGNNYGETGLGYAVLKDN
jgi:predicted GH43/DUF377 family glycosyl hydrolase